MELGKNAIELALLVARDDVEVELGRGEASDNDLGHLPALSPEPPRPKGFEDEGERLPVLELFELCEPFVHAVGDRLADLSTELTVAGHFAPDDRDIHLDPIGGRGQRHAELEGGDDLDAG